MNQTKLLQILKVYLTFKTSNRDPKPKRMGAILSSLVLYQNH